MSALAKLEEDEAYLMAILDDATGIDLAEFSFVDEENADRCYRVWDYQWSLYTDTSTYQADLCGRSLGKSQGIIMRAFAFPFCFPGQELLITAPELNHLRPVVDKIETLFTAGTRLGREMLPRVKGSGINHQPQFQARFVNNSRIVSRLPNRDGKGVKTCVGEGTLISTVRGQVPVEEVLAGDYALTDAGNYAMVRHVYRFESTPTYTVAGAGHRALSVSRRHSFLARRNANPQRARRLGEATWVAAEDAEVERYYWATPTCFPELELPAPPAGIVDVPALLELVGRYVADGFIYNGAIALVVDAAHQGHVDDLIRAVGLRAAARPHANATCRAAVSAPPRGHNLAAAVNARVVADFAVEHFGALAHAKKVPTWLLAAPRASRQAFLAGYLAGDGHWNAPKSRWEASSASKALAIGVKLLAQSLGYATGYTWTDPKVTHIGGVALKAPPRRSHRIRITEHGNAIAEGDMHWGKIRSVQAAKDATVYDLAVAGDHSYVGDGIVHLGTAFMPNGEVA